MKARDNSQKIAAVTQDPDDWRLYKNLRNTVTARMRAEKAAWHKQRLDHAQNTSTNLWNNIKGWLNWKSSGPPSQLFADGALINTPEGLATTMNRFFMNKVDRLRQGILNSNREGGSLFTTDYAVSTSDMSFQMKYFTSSRI